MLQEYRERMTHWWRGNGASVFFMRYVPIINTFILVGHIILLLLHRENLIYAEVVAGSSLSCTLLLLALSFRFHFCMLHRAFVFYDFAVEVCILLQRLNVFKSTLLAFRIGMLAVGVILITVLLFRFKHFCTYEFM